ncbi:MAG: DNA polymerase III subunit beta [Pseudobacteriovorax sp.]|nr:DNA polymerase III subunit beta [Pseudobacteriovorax sp.]
MKIKISKSQLSTATQRAQGAITERSLAQIGLMANEHSLHLSVADRVLVVYCQMSCEMLKDGQAFVPARLFTDVVRQLPDGDVHLENKGSFLEITAGQNLEFRMKLPRIESKSWREPPVIASNNKADLPSDKLMYVIDQVQFCVAHESPRNYGSVGYLHKTGDSHLRLVGTDGYRLSYSQLDLEIPKDFLSEGVCLSKRALSELHRMCGEGFDSVNLAISEDQTTLVASVPDYQIFVRLSAVKYPKYQGVLPKKELSKVNIPRPYFQSVTKRVLLASDKTRALQLCFSNSSLTLRSRTVGSSESQESIALSSYQDGSRELAINGKFLTDVFSTISSEEVTLNFHSEEDPIVLVPNTEPPSCQSVHVLVPIRES